MNIRLIQILLILICIFANGQTDSINKKFNGFEIYLIEGYPMKGDSFWDFEEVERKRFIEKYENRNQIPEENCNWFLNLEGTKIKKEPFLTENDIEYYSISDYSIKLTKSGIKKIETLNAGKISVFGKPFIIVANGKKVLGGWFWTWYSSFVCDRVYNRVDKNTEKMNLSYGGCGTDPRNKSEFLIELTLIEE